MIEWARMANGARDSVVNDDAYHQAQWGLRTGEPVQTHNQWAEIALL